MNVTVTDTVPHGTISHQCGASRYWQAVHCLHFPIAVFNRLGAGFTLQYCGATELWLHINRQSLHHRRLLVRLSRARWNQAVNPCQSPDWFMMAWTCLLLQLNLKTFCKYNNMDLKIHNPQRPSQCAVPKETTLKQITELNHSDRPGYSFLLTSWGDVNKIWA